MERDKLLLKGKIMGTRIPLNSFLTQKAKESKESQNCEIPVLASSDRFENRKILFGGGGVEPIGFLSKENFLKRVNGGISNFDGGDTIREISCQGWTELVIQSKGSSTSNGMIISRRAGGTIFS